MIKTIKLISISFILTIVSILNSCAPYEWDGFNNKDEVIIAVKENIDDLNILTKEVFDKFEPLDEKSVYIENKLFKSKNTYSYHTKIANKLFDKLRIDCIGIDYDNNCRQNCVRYEVKNKFGYVCGFYYGFNNSKNFYRYNEIALSKKKEEGTYLEYDNKTALISQRYGWYTEQICDNWYFYEEDWDYLNFMKYIYDDINTMNPPSKYYQEHKKWFEKYNPHNSVTANTIKNK